MKNLKAAIAVLGVMLLLVTCKKDPEPGIEQFKIVGEELSAGTNSATITGMYDCPITIKGLTASVTEGGNPLGDYAAELNGQSFSIGITGLRPSTTYSYYYKVDYGAAEPYVTESKTFTTLDITVFDEMPAVRTLEVLAIDSTTCRVKCQVVREGGSPVTEQGICWNNVGNPSVNDATIQCDSVGLGIYTLYMEQLLIGKQYYVRAYAKNTIGVGLSNVMSFEMSALPGMPVDIHVDCMPVEGGVAIGDGTYEAGTTCTVEAGAAAGYTFVNWTENGEQVSSEASYTFPVTVERNLVANFSAEAYIISVGIDPEEGGTATGAGGYGYGDTCTLVATPRMGYDFVKWTRDGNTVSTEAEYSFVVMESATYTALFQVKSYTISIAANPSEGGSVSGGGNFQYGSPCTVRAVPNEGYAFVNWSDVGDVVSTETDYSFSVTNARSLTANFIELQPDEYSISVSANPTDGGTVTGGGAYQEGQQCTVRATAQSGFIFVNWTENGSQVSDLAEYTFTVTSNRSLVANFWAQAPTEYTVIATANPEDGGTVTGNGTYEQGQQCTVSATANEGFTFTNWTEDSEVVSTNAHWTFIVNNDRILIANFAALATLPTVTTSEVTNITQTTAMGGGNVTADGGALVTERGICWSTSHNPTISGNHFMNGTGAGVFNCNITGLTANTTYYVRAYAINSVGTSYGSEVSFITSIEDGDVLDPVSMNLGYYDLAQSGQTHRFYYGHSYSAESYELIRQVEYGNTVDPEKDTYVGTYHELVYEAPHLVDVYYDVIVTLEKISTDLIRKTMVGRLQGSSGEMEMMEQDCWKIVGNNEVQVYPELKKDGIDHLVENQRDDVVFPEGCTIIYRYELGSDGLYYRKCFVKSGDSYWMQTLSYEIENE